MCSTHVKSDDRQVKSHALVTLRRSIMKWSKLWISLGILGVCLTQYTQECSPPKDWQPMEPFERAKKAQIVVYGTVVSSPRRKGKSGSGIEGPYIAVFRLHCVVKGPKLQEFVNITGFGDFTGGFCVHSTALLNKSYIVFVERDYDNPRGLRVQEINIQKASVHVGHGLKSDNLAILREVMFSAGNNASLPIGARSTARPGCPDFSSLESKSRDPVRATPKHQSCRCRKKKHKQKKRKRISKDRTLPPTELWQDNAEDYPTLPRTRRYHVLTRDKGNIEVLVHDDEADPVSDSATHPQRGFWWWWIMLTFHSPVFTLIVWQHT